MELGLEFELTGLLGVIPFIDSDNDPVRSENDKVEDIPDFNRDEFFLNGFIFDSRDDNNDSFCSFSKIFKFKSFRLDSGFE
ncbi:unnamed protein product [[Candida] boidinii]|nr:unnamed protein product [[Candida] boidinii]